MLSSVGHAHPAERLSCATAGLQEKADDADFVRRLPGAGPEALVAAAEGALRDGRWSHDDTAIIEMPSLRRPRVAVFLHVWKHESRHELFPAAVPCMMLRQMHLPQIITQRQHHLLTTRVEGDAAPLGVPKAARTRRRARRRRRTR